MLNEIYAVTFHKKLYKSIAEPQADLAAAQVVELAIKNRLPLMAEATEDIEAGALVSYSANEGESFRRAAWYVDKILTGAKPADLPVEQPTKPVHHKSQNRQADQLHDTAECAGESGSGDQTALARFARLNFLRRPNPVDLIRYVVGSFPSTKRRAFRS